MRVSDFVFPQIREMLLSFTPQTVGAEGGNLVGSTHRRVITNSLNGAQILTQGMMIDSICRADQGFDRSLSTLPLTHPHLFPFRPPPFLLHHSEKTAKGISAKVLTGAMS